MRFTKVLIFAAFCIFLLMAGCSTTNHAPLATMVYQDITGHYNAYFNANEKMKGVYAALDKAHKDNYKEVLPIFTYSNPKEAASAGGDLDEIVKRLTLSVQIHKVSNWADDDFVMMGRAYYIKGNYDKAMAFFKYTTTEYKNGVDYVKEMKKMHKIAKPTLKKKPVVKPKFEQVLDEKGNLMLNKIDQRPSYSLMIHEPARAEALLWLTKTYSSQKKFTEASAVVQLMRHDDKFYTNLDKDVELVDAENFMNQKDYNDAIKPLEKFLTMTSKKSERVRPIFILAQIYEMKGDYAKASDYYKQVLDNKPTYEMEFYAKIKRAKLGNKSGSNDEIKKLLITMSHDGKYKDYLDQIYYELGEIVLGENNRAEARKDFHKSIASSTKNSDQKALSFLALARMDYEEEFYVSSKFFYDSTLHDMSKSDTAYESVEARDKTLGKLVKQIDIINTEDSLQRIANMAPAQRSRFLQNLIDTKQKEADARQSSKSGNTDFAKQNAPGGVPGQGGTTDEASSFYFYNVTARSNGYSDFIKKWGDRKLEDNWRRKDKSATLVDNSDQTDSVKGKDTTTVVKGSEEEKLMAGLPMTPEKMEKSNGKLIEAYYALGTVYKDDLQSYHKAILAFEELNKRFPKNKLELESFYQLYLLYDRQKNGNKADYYKNAILADYPNSTIAKYLKDPGYLEELKKKDNALSFYYESAYKDYSSGMYASAEQKIRDVDAQFKENKMKAKFDILNAMSLSKENRLTDYVESLNKIIAKYPGTPEKDQAQKWLTALNHSKLPQRDISKLPKDSLEAANVPVMAAIPDMDTTGRAAFLQQMEDAKKAQAKADAQTELLKTLADAKASANAPKDNSTADKSAKPYKPLTRAQRLDSLIKAEKATKNQSTTVVSNPTASDAGTAPSSATLQPAPVADASAAPAKNTVPASKPSPVAAARPAFDTDTATDIFGKSDNAPHHVIIYFLDPAAYNYAIVNKIDNFNGTAFEANRLTTKSSLLDKDNKLIMVKQFKNKDSAQTYLTALAAKINELMPGISPDQYFLGSISMLNYSTLISTKKINNYARFYRANYTAISGIPNSGGSAASAIPIAATGAAPASNAPTAKQTAAANTPAAKTPAAAKDTVIKKTATTAAKTANKDSVAKKPKTTTATANTTPKDTVAKKPKASTGTTTAKTTPKDTAAKKPQTNTKTVAKDTVATKPAAKAATKPAPVAAARPAFDTDTLTEVYGKSDNAPHYVVLYFLDPAAYNYAIVGKLDNFNSTAFAADRLSTRSTLLDKDNKLMMVKQFKNKDAAQAYLAALSAKLSEVMPGINPDQYFLGSISVLNYGTLIESKKINNYLRFYRANYK